jgi:hypothetical protein
VAPRRVAPGYYDLTGLPPPDDVRGFLGTSAELRSHRGRFVSVSPTEKNGAIARSRPGADRTIRARSDKVMAWGYRDYVSARSMKTVKTASSRTARGRRTTARRSAHRCNGFQRLGFGTTTRIPSLRSYLDGILATTGEAMSGYSRLRPLSRSQNRSHSCRRLLPDVVLFIDICRTEQARRTRSRPTPTEDVARS